jgi:chemotaxis protein CheC
MLSELEADALRELVNIGVGRAASTLNDMLEHHISLEIPQIQVVEKPQLPAFFTSSDTAVIASVYLAFQGELNGIVALVFPLQKASILASALTGEDPATIAVELRQEVLIEIGNIVLNNVMGSIGNMLEKELTYNVPTYEEHSVERLIIESTIPTDSILLAHTQFSIKNIDVAGEIVVMFDQTTMQSLYDTLAMI